MTAQDNREVVTLENQHVGTISSHLRDFTRMNTLTFYGSKVEEDLQVFIDKTYKILYAMGLTTSVRRSSSPHTNLRMWPKLGTSNREIICLYEVER